MSFETRHFHRVQPANIRNVPWEKDAVHVGDRWVFWGCAFFAVVWVLAEILS